MVAIKADADFVHVDLPTKGLTPDQVNDLVNWLRVEAIARHSKLTPNAAWQLSEEVKAGWWERNKDRFGEPIAP